MVKPSIYQCCLNKSFSDDKDCSGSFVLINEDNFNTYKYTNCNNIFNDNNQSDQDDNYGWTNHINDYKQKQYQLLATDLNDTYLNDIYLNDTYLNDSESDEGYVLNPKLLYKFTTGIFAELIVVMIFLILSFLNLLRTLFQNE